MTTYTFSQLEQLWEQAGGSPALASYAAATAIIESGGNPAAINAGSGAAGLMQLIPSNQHLIPGGSANVYNALDNMKGAVALSGNTLAGLISNWTDWETTSTGARYTEASVNALAKSLGGTTTTGTTTTPPATPNPGGPNAGSSGGTTANPGGPDISGTTQNAGSNTDSGSYTTGTGPELNGPDGAITFAESLPVIGSLVAALQPLMHALATVIDYSFAMFEPGQGQRALFALAALVLAFFAYRVLSASGTLPKVGVM